MQYCGKCKVSVVGKRSQCPLCQGALSGDGDETEEVFPVLPDQSARYAMLLRILIFLTLTAIVVCGALDLLLPGKITWSLYVAAASACMWVCLGSILYRRANIPKNIIWMVFWVSLLAVFWDWWTGWRGWSVDYVIPSACMFAMVLMAVVARLFHLEIDDYMIYFILDGLFGILPLAFYLLGWLRVVYPSVLCAAGSAISLAALFSFEGQRLREEFRKRLHL